ncbi:MAG: hypothetical protein F7B17_05540 [Desulfurococcales archaeon]|nr:hypothetical protein [Desulfurococcales archaeon]
MSEGGCEEVRRDMAVLASLARRVAAFASAAAGAYSFFAFGMSIVGFIAVSGPMARLLGFEPGGVVAVLAVILGTIASLVLIAFVPGPVWRWLASQGFGGEWSARDTVATLTAFIGGFALAYIPSPALGEWYPPVAWYLGLTLAFITLYVYDRTWGRTYAAPTFGVAAVLTALTAPIPLYISWSIGPQEGSTAAAGLMLLSYLAAGSYALRKAASALEG